MVCQRPRLLMTRKVQTISKDIFINVVDQLKPWTQDEWAVGNILSENLRYFTNWHEENHFFLHHTKSYSAPRLRRPAPGQTHAHLRALSDRGLSSYFSCNPANIDIERTVLMFEAASILSNIQSKASMTRNIKKLRCLEFSEAYKKILQLLS